VEKLILENPGGRAEGQSGAHLSAGTLRRSSVTYRRRWKRFDAGEGRSVNGPLRPVFPATWSFVACPKPWWH